VKINISGRDVKISKQEYKTSSLFLSSFILYSASSCASSKYMTALTALTALPALTAFTTLAALAALAASFGVRITWRNSSAAFLTFIPPRRSCGLGELSPS
jgi:hypothetical protein